jgi:hypothetical protein
MYLPPWLCVLGVLETPTFNNRRRHLIRSIAASGESSHPTLDCLGRGTAPRARAVRR